MMRMIFSTVAAPHEPAFTVGSFAMTATGRPPTDPTPVTTPSAGRSPAIARTSRPSSAKGAPSSRKRRRRSRTKSFPCSASFWWYFGAPPSRARTLASAIASLSPVTVESVARWVVGFASCQRWGSSLANDPDGPAGPAPGGRRPRRQAPRPPRRLRAPGLQLPMVLDVRRPGRLQGRRSLPLVDAAREPHPAPRGLARRRAHRSRQGPLARRAGGGHGADPQGRAGRPRRDRLDRAADRAPRRRLRDPSLAPDLRRGSRRPRGRRPEGGVGPAPAHGRRRHPVPAGLLPPARGHLGLAARGLDRIRPGPAPRRARH